MTTLTATYVGQGLHPDQSLSLPPSSRVQITVEGLLELMPGTVARASFLETAESLNQYGPPNWSERLDEYLSGTCLVKMQWICDVWLKSFWIIGLRSL